MIEIRTATSSLSGESSIQESLLRYGLRDHSRPSA